MKGHCYSYSSRAYWATCAILCFSISPLASGTEFEGHVIIFGGDAAYPPFEWIDGARPRGFDVDLEDAMVEMGGAKAEHKLGDWPDAVRALESGEVDVLAMFHSEEREELFLFTPPFHFVNHAIYARIGYQNVSSIDELQGRRVAVEELSHAHEHIRSQKLPFELVLMSDTLTGLQALTAHRADYAILAAPTADKLIRDHKLRLANVGPPLWPRGYAFAVRKDRPELAEWLTQRYFDAVRTGAYQEIYARWEDELDSRDESTLPRAFGLAAIPLAALAMMGLGWALWLRGDGIARRAHLLQEAGRRVSAETRAQWIADHDVYTELPRLHHFSRLVSELLLRTKPEGAAAKQIVALKLADLDKIIRTLGHEAGLAVARDFIARLRAMNFDVCGQTGRDVFLIFGDKRHIDTKLRGLVSPTDTLVMDANPAPTSFAGAATWPKHGKTLPELLRRAETALAVATEKREGWVEYRSSMEPDERDLQLLEMFRETAGADLYPTFQPQVDVLSGEIVGAEALVRWQPAAIGSVPPTRFIPLLEDAGLIRHVTTRMLRESIRVSAEARRLGVPCPISVNVSVSDLLTDRTQKVIFKALQTYNGVPRDLKLELTETSIAEQPDTVKWVITRLRDSGICTSIDDFGTGYSSLSYLSDFPIRELKIDRSFVNGMSRRPKDRSIVRSTIAMAHELGLLVVAEGVETQADMAMLRGDNCDRAQGYLISMPLREAQFLKFLKTAPRSHSLRSRVSK